MLRSLVLMALVGCSFEDDIQRATDDAVAECRDVVAEQIPEIVVQVTAAALAACRPLVERVADIDDAVRLTTYEVLSGMGCDWTGVRWNCQASIICAGRDW